MMPDLGKYATEVGLAYAVSLVLLVAVVAISVWQSKRAARALEEVERRKDG